MYLQPFIDWFVPIGVGVLLWIVTKELLDHVEASTRRRAGVGALFLAAGIAILAWPGAHRILQDLVLKGVWAFLVGFGINLLAAPFRGTEDRR